MRRLVRQQYLKWGYDGRGDTFQLGRPEKMLRMARDPMKWDGKVYRRVRFGDDGSIKGTAKEAEMRMRRQRYARKREADR